MATFTSAALIVACAALGFYLIRWGVRGLSNVLKILKEKGK
ncbi:MAG: hypothetical protein WCQ52_07030 [Actinomycetes bacterium]